MIDEISCLRQFYKSFYQLLVELCIVVNFINLFLFFRILTRYVVKWFIFFPYSSIDNISLIFFQLINTIFFTEKTYNPLL